MNWQWDDRQDVKPVGSRVIDWFDPRLRVLTLGLLALAAVTAKEWTTLVALLVLTLVLSFLAEATLGRIIRRCLPLLGFGMLLIAVLPWTVPGQPLGDGFLASASVEGLNTAILIWARATLIVLGGLGLVGSLEIPVIGHVLAHFRIPAKLVHLLLFAVRYLKVLEDEYRRLQTAMTLRGFRPGWNRHTFWTYGQLVGMLLVRSLARSERIITAMRCRGFRGHFYLWHHFHYSWRDVILLVVVLATGLMYLRCEGLL